MTQREKVTPVRRRRFPLAALLLILFLAAASAVLLLNRWQLRLTLRGDGTCTLECGEVYREDGADAVFGGVLFLPELAFPEVRVRGSVDTRVPGDYTVTYSAEYLLYRAERTRTVRVRDTVPPELTLLGDPETYTLPGHSYAEEGFEAWDAVDGDLTHLVERREEGGRVYYSVSDRSGNTVRAERTIRYDDPYPPTLVLLGPENIVLPRDTPYREPGWVARDNADGDLNGQVRVTGEVHPEIPGEYVLCYTVEDRLHNTASAFRTVTVEAAPEPTGYVYLTFDDGPSKHTQRLLDILDEYGVKVTFFVVDHGYRDMIAKEAAAGHSIGVHSATHDYSRIYAGEDAFFSDLDRMNEIIREQTGAYTDIIRFPGGSSNTVSRFNPGIMTRLVKAVEERGYVYFDWNVSSGDAGLTTDPDVVYRNVIEGIQQNNPAVVLMHDSLGYTVSAVERIITWCLENGYALLPLDRDSPTAHHTPSN